MTIVHRAAISVVTTSVIFLSCQKPAPLDILIPFDGTIQTQGCNAASQKNNIEFSKFRKHKALVLASKNTIRYNCDDHDLSSGSASMWVKLESLPPKTPQILISIGSSAQNQISLGFLDRSVYVSRVIDNSIENWTSNSKPGRRGVWVHIALNWNFNQPDQTAQVSINGNTARLAVGNDFFKKRNLGGGLDFGSDSNAQSFSALIRDFVLRFRAATPAQIKDGYKAEIKEMYQPMQFHAVDLEHYAGKKITMADADHHQAWSVDNILAASAPIKVDSNSNYRLTFRVKPLSGIAPDMLRCSIWSTTKKEKLITSWQNGYELIHPNKYRSITIPFRTGPEEAIEYTFQTLIPSKFSLLMDTISMESTSGNWQHISKAMNLHHTAGVWKEDPEAQGGKAWSNANTLLYGPYICIGQPGRYRASWRVKISDSIPARTPVLLLDVYAHDGFLQTGRRGTRSYGKLALSSEEFSKRNQWETKSLDFRYDGANMLEFRAHAKWMEPGSIAIDVIDVRPLDAPGL